MRENMKVVLWYLIGALPKIALTVIAIAVAVHISEQKTARMVDEMLTEALEKQYVDVAGYPLPTQAIPPREGVAPSLGKEPVAETQPENKTDDGAIQLLATSMAGTTVEDLLKAEASWNVKTTSYPMYHSDETTTAWAADTAYCVRVDMPRVIFQDLERNVVEVVYPESVKAGEEGVIVIRVKNKGSGAEFITRATFAAADDLRIVYGSSHPQTAYGGELDYGLIGNGKSLVVNFYTGATDEHYRNRHNHHSFSDAYGYVDAGFYRVQTTAEDVTIN